MGRPGRATRVLARRTNRCVAQCSCGQLAVAVRGESVRVSVCHCLACQRRTGSVFGAQARFAREAVALTGEASEFVRKADSGTGTARFRFCRRCGATLCCTSDENPGAIVIPVGAFADPSFPAPTFSVYEARQHAWVGVPGAVEHRDWRRHGRDGPSRVLMRKRLA